MFFLYEAHLMFFYQSEGRNGILQSLGMWIGHGLVLSPQAILPDHLFLMGDGRWLGMLGILMKIHKILTGAARSSQSSSSSSVVAVVIIVTKLITVVVMVAKIMLSVWWSSHHCRHHPFPGYHHHHKLKDCHKD